MPPKPDETTLRHVIALMRERAREGEAAQAKMTASDLQAAAYAEWSRDCLTEVADWLADCCDRERKAHDSGSLQTLIVARFTPVMKQLGKNFVCVVLAGVVGAMDRALVSSGTVASTGRMLDSAAKAYRDAQAKRPPRIGEA